MRAVKASCKLGKAVAQIFGQFTAAGHGRQEAGDMLGQMLLCWSRAGGISRKAVHAEMPLANVMRAFAPAAHAFEVTVVRELVKIMLAIGPQ